MTYLRGLPDKKMTNKNTESANSNFAALVRRGVRSPPMKIVEIGVLRGEFGSSFLKNLNYSFQYTGIDPWLAQVRAGPDPDDSEGHNSSFEADDIHQERMVQTIRAFKEHWRDVRLFKLGSREASRIFENGTVDFVFCDGRHTFNGVTQDLVSWWPKMAPGGLLTGHDYSNQHVRDAVESFAARLNLNLMAVTLFDQVAWKFRAPQ
eukprot:GEMP01082452.1.p1 GENE.GEMP01082452.1~~GEMP01082452.1.p1  ORF type:complete len:206 (+),score=28.08 GEMP01082452.1:132-749(+)